MANTASQDFTLFDWATTRQAAKAVIEKDFTEKASRLSKVTTELYEAEASNAPHWRLEKLRREFHELEQDCNAAKKALRQFN
jgi:muramidase (phage lysozyme)